MRFVAATPVDDEFWNLPTPVEARARLVDALRYELLGPSADEEELFESPVTRYLTGLLAPYGTGVLPSERDDSWSADGGEEDAGIPEGEPPMSQAMTPSSIGLSFLVDGNIARLHVTAAWGDYERIKRSDDADDEEAEAAGFEEDEKPEVVSDGEPNKKRERRPRWHRIPKAPEPIDLVLKPDEGLQRTRCTTDDDITVEHLARRIGDRLAVSVFLVNRRAAEGARASADRWIFQPTVEVTAVDGTSIFQPRELEPALGEPDRDLRSNRLLYRDKLEFAIGHGCAAAWDEPVERRSAAVRTSLIPAYELPRVEPRLLNGNGLEMSVLAECQSGDRLRELLAPLLSGYEDWIGERNAQLSELPEDLQRTANDHLDDCRNALRRMSEAIDALAGNEDALRAFRFANRAMLLQRSHSVWAAARRKQKDSAPASPTIEGRWRPFQLAFILINLPGLIDPRHDDRRIGDLLWFPTGGGKTEAYLGLTAFVLGYRRLRAIAGYRTDAGVAVLMRYTLRLLTIQQFQRAVALICACEVIRAEDSTSWGSRRFSIGLWVGISATPTTHAESRIAIANLKAHQRQTQRNPCQLETCPWCGEKLQPADYVDDSDALRTFVYCPRDECEFSKKSPKGLPVVLVDEEIYRECPSMLIATVDKFAQMPWNGQIQALFGRVEEECTRCGFLTPDSDHSSAHGPELVHPTEKLAPLDLIIQDELHLISGPLGTLVGLYETAVNALSSRFDGDTVVAPKVIASTATVRRAFEQVHALFDRPLRVFPPPGLDPADSYFAVEAPVSADAPGRLYVGVMGPGKSMKTGVVRLAAILMATAQGLADRDARIADPYRTLVMYFNSLRELGGAVRLMDDDVVSRLDQLRLRGLPRTFPPDYEELTSRISSEQIPVLLRQLEQPHDAPRDADSPYPLDAVLASNMISVGVDVDRLALMTVMGQPKTTAEYIQATGRVGRQTWAPGLVITLYNWVRPRDLSHYERFLQYHATFYRSIEAVSATPFSSRARDRGLPGALVSIARLGDFPMAAEDAAEDFDGTEPTVTFAAEQLRRRAESVADAATAADVEQQIAGLLSEWQELADDPLRYGWRAPDRSKVPPSAVLLRQAEGGLWGEWDTPGSLREVEETSRVYLLGLDGT
jgi:hypothetical protein